MDKKGRFQEHSKVKLELYRSYLELYLTVLLNSQRYQEVHIHDIFAGKGQSEDGNKGSALLAAIEIQKVRERFPNTPVFLKLNEKQTDHFENLKTVLKPFGNLPSISNDDANNYITAWNPTAGCHNLFFIDPHGYTQISTENLKRLFTMNGCDFLIFMPIYHIYRFLKPAGLNEEDQKADTDFFAELGIDTPPATTVDREKYYKPIANFLSGLGIAKDDAVKCENVENFSQLIAASLKRISGSEYVYTQMIKKQGCNSKYCLFFLSHHILGAEKFLDAQHELKEKTKTPSHQQEFDFVSTPENDKILNFVQHEQPYDNIALYVEGIKWGFRPSDTMAQLKALEKDFPHKIQVTTLLGQQRNRGGFYISYKNFKEGNRKISVMFRG